MPVTAYLALGSNLGDRRANLDQALAALRSRSGIRVTRVSANYDTAPVGGPPGQGTYLNAAAALETDLPAPQLLSVLHEIEIDLGRVRRERDGPRTLDLDLLLYGNLISHSDELTVPHPRLHERLFVLVPLAEIAPGAIHPVLRQTVGQLLAQRLGVRPSGPVPGRELHGLRALVTGSTSGIGRAIARELADGGADVLIHGRRPSSEAESAVSEVRASGARTAVLAADLGEEGAWCRLADEAWAVWGGLDVLVNNAGADTLTGFASAWPFERKLRELLAVDVTATINLSRDLGGRMKSGQGGVILNMGWDQAENGMEGDSGELFSAAKGSVMAFSRSLALSLAPRVRVNCLAPGWVRTAWGERASEVWQERVIRETPLQRWGRPEDVASLARWAASPAAAYITGQVLRANGGAVR